MTSKKKPTIVWFAAITCNGNTHSLLSANASRLELLFDSFDLIYHPSLTIDKSLNDVLLQNEKIDFLLIEGAISANKNVLPKDLLSYSDAVADNIYRALKYDE